jgi:hypothetical protein
MRFYSFTNFYLSSIQQGIQPAHCIADLFVKYADESPQRAALLDWAANHKTMICLNGGNAAGIKEVYEALHQVGTVLELPFGKFHEDEQSLDGTMTCCGIVVPQPIYDAAAAMRTEPEYIAIMLDNGGDLSEDEVVLARLLNMYGLAK